jgi:branched-chain amino acid transport system substrate-binding protein
MKRNDTGRAARLTRRGLGALALGAAVSTSGWIRGARAAEPLKLGVLLPRSGFLALIGQQCQRGCDVAAPILKDMGYSVELINADFESNPDVARTQAEKLIREGAQMLLGAFESGATLAIAQVCEQRGVPFVVNIGADPKITEQGFKYTFRNFPTSLMLTRNGLSLMNELFRATGTAPKTAVLTHVNDSFGQSMLNVITRMAPSMNLPFKILDTIAYDPRARDLSVEVAKAKAAGAELHISVCRLNDGILLVREMVKQKYEPMGVIGPGNPGMYEKQFLKTLGKYAEYCISNVPWFDPKQEPTQTLEKAFVKAYPDESFELNIGFSFEAVYVAADAAKRAGSNAPQALVEALRTTNLEKRVMIGGPIRFDDKGQNVDLASAVVQNRGGRPTVVLPAASAEMPPVFPMPPWSQRT